MKKGAFLVSLLLTLVTFTQKTYAQEVWKSLSEVTYKISQDNFGELYVPVFSENIKKLEGKVVEADGYIIPFEGMFKPTHIILSSLPLAECFFCGSGGPETVMEVMLSSPIKYTSKRVKVRGKLTLNTADPEKLMYILKEAVLVEN
ncbi:MAG: hypothetical protein NWS90_04580 [Algoriphagus sp.]|jgi:hypothetical protein|uniref:hypothetical protein n=1 Tax=Algoriphagus sp. TaxID=1872435 RepID=UPI002745C9C9|nr:hypothetical protein [Algoriphagus sp.]MDP4748507.1 hypothetical protein [Algoriphagus sp.]MDP4838787.1 hypothetical protein [Algoriphagus sp.]MDP4903347.1 hypothetical protein [Algoriphagus sp.]MDP4957385.1 hypothetical protein [Algoriphagus sp.]